MESVSSFAPEAADAWGDAVGRNPQTGRGASSPPHPVVTAAGDEKELNLACWTQPAAAASTEDTSNICWSHFHSQGLPNFGRNRTNGCQVWARVLEGEGPAEPPCCFQSGNPITGSYENSSAELWRSFLWPGLTLSCHPCWGQNRPWTRVLKFYLPRKSWIITLNN